MATTSLLYVDIKHTVVRMLELLTKIGGGITMILR